MRDDLTGSGVPSRLGSSWALASHQYPSVFRGGTIKRTLWEWETVGSSVAKCQARQVGLQSRDRVLTPMVSTDQIFPVASTNEIS